MQIGYQYIINYVQDAVLEGKPVSYHLCKMCKASKTDNVIHYYFVARKLYPVEQTAVQRPALIHIFIIDTVLVFDISGITLIFYRLDNM